MIEAFTDSLSTGPRTSVLPYAADATLEELSRAGSVGPVFAPSVSLKRRLDNKNENKAIFGRLGLPLIDSRAGVARASVLEEAGLEFGFPIVARAPVSSTGSGTFLVPSREDARAFLAQASAYDKGDALPWIFEPFIPGLAFNATAVAFRERTVLYPPSVQVIGHPLCTDLRFGFCGSDYQAAVALSASALGTIGKQTEAIGSELAGMGFRGLFGVDYILDEGGTLRPCEINPRLQNSTALLNFSYRSNPKDSPACRHIESFLSPEPSYNGERVMMADDDYFSQVILYAPVGDGFTPSVLGVMRQGLYALLGGGIEYLRPEWDPARVSGATFLAVATTDSAGADVEQGAAVARLIFRGSVLTSDRGDLHPEVRSIVSAVRNLIFGAEHGGEGEQ